MFEANQRYVLRDGHIFAICYMGTREEAFADARDLADMLNAREREQRTPHPATEFSPADLAFVAAD